MVVAAGAADLRVVEIEGKPWFLGTDIRTILGILQGGRWLAALSPDDVRVVPRGLISGKGMNQAQIISESGLYKLIMRSDKPEARQFQEWVTRDVLPAIRKDGAYVVGAGCVLCAPSRSPVVTVGDGWRSRLCPPQPARVAFLAPP